MSAAAARWSAYLRRITGHEVSAHGCGAAIYGDIRGGQKMLRALKAGKALRVTALISSGPVNDMPLGRVILASAVSMAAKSCGSKSSHQAH
jgi:lysophospholipid acyltransferase (LPLAT)-like uncharacterized protein